MDCRAAPGISETRAFDLNLVDCEREKHKGVYDDPMQIVYTTKKNIKHFHKKVMVTQWPKHDGTTQV
jgi:hypothetical protein